MIQKVRLGAMPPLALLAAAGLLLVALGNNAAREGHAGAQALFWAGLAVIYAPIAFRLLGSGASRAERIGLVLTLAISLYLVKVVRSPAEFVRFDELGWWRATHEAVLTGHLFEANPLNPATAGFPSLAAVTAALAQLTGLSIFHSGLIVIGVARTVLVLALFLFLVRLTGSNRGAGIGIVVYACNPSFLYFDAQFGYESLALALAAAFLLAALRWSRIDRVMVGGEVGGTAALVVLLACGLAVTHHMTSLAVVGFVALWLLLRKLRVRRGELQEERSRGPLLPLLAIAIAFALWFAFVAGGETIHELGGVFSRAFNSIVDLVSGQSGSKKLFSGAGEKQSLEARALAVCSVIPILVLLVVGLRAAWRERVRDSLRLALCAVALLYPISLGLRLTQAGSETSQRASEFVFLGVAFLAALLVAGRDSFARRVLPRLALAAIALVTFVGAFLLGELQATRQPGPYLVGAEDRSVTPQGVAAADFAAAHLPPRSRLLTDRTNATLLGSYGGMDPIFGRYAGLPLPRVLFTPRFEHADERVIHGQSLSFVVVDRRLRREPPLIGYYVESDEPGAFVRRRAVGPAALAKLRSVPGVSKIYANGPIVVYDTSELTR
ncbi:MAG TPA: hypothetical protein VHS74_03645 [Solirubrobacterales bacterium]|jgi:hypothetical protein|nr:hypothetical protein [Solirubrobacterales bacterium]